MICFVLIAHLLGSVNCGFFSKTPSGWDPKYVDYDMTQQKGETEREDLSMNICNDVGEAYSAAFLTTREHILEVQSQDYNLSWVNCEMASFIHMKGTRKYFKDVHGPGMVMQSLDVLDYSVIHLSAFERSSKKYRHSLWKDRKDYQVRWREIEEVKRVGDVMEDLYKPKKGIKQRMRWSSEAKRTVAVMPFLGGAMGAGHSELGNRFHYLRACFWSVYQHIPNIVAGVTRQEDIDWIWKESGLPFYDLILLDKLPKSAGLPVGLTQAVRAKFIENSWEQFDYVFYTESDQLVLWRTQAKMYDHLKKYPKRMMIPHRLMPYSPRVAGDIHHKPLHPIYQGNQSCCLPRQNCYDRTSWIHIKDPQVEVINYHGLHVPLGNCDFLIEKYRHCTMLDHQLPPGQYCT